MDLKYKFNAKEYAMLQGITASALRKRRLSGKLEGQYIKKGSEYFYCITESNRPNKVEFTPNNSRKRRRGVHGPDTNYHRVRNGHQFKLHNDLKQLARINRRLKEEEIDSSGQEDEIIAEIADNNIPIYTYDLLQYASNNFDLIQPSDLQGDEPSVTSIIQANIYEILTEELYAYVTTIQDNKKENEKE